MNSKKKDRVKNFGEVFTAEKEVQNMLALVEDETLRIDSKFLETACGEGIFLEKILNKKIKIIEDKYKSSQTEFEKYLLQAVTSIYGIEILEDNVNICRNILLKIVEQKYKSIFRKTFKENYLSCIKFVLSKNIVWGDALSYKSKPENKPIIFSEWSFISEGKIKRMDYSFSDLVSYQPFGEGTLFSDLGEKVIIPDPIKSYEPIHYMSINNHVTKEL